ncbi:uncharacterized protein [Aegilops tauschii subsp. strangulata]|nr:uncharacterized protein LOC109774622 [Aegilops tauschii subsp. strangulata]
MTAPMTTTQEEEHDMAGGKSSSISKPQIENAASQEEKDSHEEEIEELWEEMEETMSESEVSDSDEDEDHVEGGESGSTISKRQISKLCEDMEVTLSYLRRDIEPAAPLRETAEDDADEALPPTIHAILEQFKDLRRHMSKLRLQLQPFKERHDEKWAKEDSYEGLDDEEKVRKKIDKEEMFFDIYRRSTESSCRRVVFEQQTTLSPMYFTHWTPGQILPNYAETEGISLQVYSFKITKIKGNLCWPLQVYGVVAARDNSDRKRNIIFNRLRHDCQEIFSDDPFLRLTGPSRAIMALSPLNFEVQLKLKGATESGDRALMNLTEHYVRGISNTITFSNCLCKAELRVEELSSSVQATFLGVRVVKDGPCPFEYGGRVACSSPPREVVRMDDKGIPHFVVDSCFQVVLLDSRHCVRGKMPIGEDGCLDLSRRFVSVKLQKENNQQFKECLAVVFEAYSESGDIAAQTHVRIKPRTCNISQHTCDLGGSKVEITIAWSAIVRTDLI